LIKGVEKNMKNGFTVISRPGGAEVRLTHPDAEGRPPLVTFARAQDCAAVLFGRLYHRHDLLAALRPRLTGQSLAADEANDAVLALAAYRHLGPDWPARLEGDFALVVWDGGRGCLVGTRDPLGGYPLFWTLVGETVAFSTSLFALLDLQPRRTLNPEFLAEFLAMAEQRSELAGEACAYQGVHRVLPGTLVSASLGTRQIQRQGYWDWLAHAEEPGTDRVEEIAPRYAELLRAAVRERVQGPTLAHLSGGMDSTAVALLARDEVVAGTVPGPLHTLSLVYERLPKLARERPYIEKALQGQTGFVAHRLVADDLLDYDGLNDPPPHEEPYAVLWRMAMDRATVTATAAAGASTMLTGFGADEMLDGKPFHLTDWLRRGRLLAAWREAGRWAQAWNCNAWEVLRPFGLEGLKAQLGIGYRGAWRGSGDLRDLHPRQVPPWVSPDFARRHGLQERMHDAARKLYCRSRRTTLSVALSALADRTGDILSWAVAAPLGISMAHPFLDRRVLALGLGVKMRSRPEPGRMKPLLAEALRGVLPEHITGRRAKGHFDEVYYLGLGRNLPRLAAMVRQAPIEDLGMIDKDVLIQSLEEASLGGPDGRRLHRLDLTLCLLKWLSLHEQWQGDRRPASEVIELRREAEAPASNGWRREAKQVRRMMLTEPGASATGNGSPVADAPGSEESVVK
jgi:asparagine synthase (glutamine-hydrolysing)